MKVALTAPGRENLAVMEDLCGVFHAVVASGNYVRGEQVEAFEAAWAAACGAKHCVAVASGTDALYLAIRAMERYFEREGAALPRMYGAVVPAHTFVATGAAVVLAKKPLYLVDVDLATGVADLQTMALQAERHLAHSAERAVLLPVSLYGHPVLGRSNDLAVVEDHAQGHGLFRKGQVAAYSFYPTKNLGALGQAGAVVTDDDDLAQRLRVLANHGEEGGRFRHTYVAGNHRMDEVQAALLRVKLPHLAAWTARRRKAASWYRAHWTALGLDRFFPLQADHPEHVYHCFALRTPSSSHRLRLQEALAQAGVETAVRYPLALHEQPCFAVEGVTYPHAEAWAHTGLTLPMHPFLQEEEVAHVVATVHTWARQERLL